MEHLFRDNKMSYKIGMFSHRTLGTFRSVLNIVKYTHFRNEPWRGVPDYFD